MATALFAHAKTRQRKDQRDPALTDAGHPIARFRGLKIWASIQAATARQSYEGLVLRNKQVALIDPCTMEGRGDRFRLIDDT